MTRNNHFHVGSVTLALFALMLIPRGTQATAAESPRYSTKEFKTRLLKFCDLATSELNKSIKRDALYWEHGGNAAIRVGDWKLVRAGGKGPWELYNLKSDRTELHNLAAEKPELVKQLVEKWKKGPVWSLGARQE